MIKNKELYSLKVSFLCAIIILSGVFITKDVSVFGVDNTATILNTSQASTNAVSKINSYTSQAESLAKKINSKWTTSSSKQNYKTQLNSILAKRKNLIIDSYKKGIPIDSISKLSSSAERSVLDINLIEKKLPLQTEKL